ncbi:MAG: type II toxin-antitoxin system RelE/ParE family toxin [Actinomycetota bacterium]|jgi:mRNA interferase RelE/StbE|nr:type II toxin-antitoxin system RelE/ParE family toxin [Actinomycetota bacterium]
MRPEYELRLSRAASRALGDELPLAVALAVWEFLTGPLAENPRKLGKPLSGQLAGHHSARRGSYRVVYTIAEDPGVIHVVRIDHRRSVYHR